jgi:hypothetical protein
MLLKSNYLKLLPTLKNTNFNLLTKLSFIGFSSKDHLKHNKNNPKHYRRIAPAARNLMKKHHIKEEDLPDTQIVKKEHIIELIKNLEKMEKSKPKETANKKTTNVYDDLASISTNQILDYSEFKNKLPHSYFYNTANVEKVIQYIADININNHKNLKIEDFVSKVDIIHINLLDSLPIN